METKEIALVLIHENKGQISGVPKNPRIIKNDRYKKLVQSIKDDPEMLALRELIVVELDIDRYVCIAGNMRKKAMEELGYDSAPCKVLPLTTPVEKLKAIIIKDNVSFGKNDMDLLTNDWNLDDLMNWGVDDIALKTTDKDNKGVYDNTNCLYPLIAQYDEKYTAIIIICRTETEEANVRTKLNIPEKAQSYKNSYLGKTNVIYGDEIK